MGSYPRNARGDAKVVLRLDIDEEGRVTSSTLLSGVEPFVTEARAVVRKWRFLPATRAGVPEKAGVRAMISFQDPQPIAALEPLADEPDEVVVSAERRAEIGSSYVPSEESRQIPGTYGDPLKVAEVLPGAALILSGLPYVFLRGAPPGNIGYFIDGIRVPLLSHVGLGSPVIAPALIDRVDVIPSAYPARFGRAAGGIIAGETTPFSPVGRGEFEARAFDARGLVEAPLADGRVNLAIGGGASYANPIVHLVAPDYSLSYWDYQARVGIHATAEDTITFLAFGARDRLDSNALDRSLFDTQFNRLDLRWDRNTATGDTRFSITAGTDRVGNASEELNANGFQLETSGVHLRWDTDQTIAKGVALRAGMDLGIDRVSNEQDLSEGLVHLFPRHDDLSGSFYIDTVLRGAGVDVVPGVRVDAARWRNVDYLFCEPRLAARLRLFGGLSWVSQFGLAHQHPTQTVRIPGLSADPLEAYVQEAWQAAQGLEIEMSPTLRGKVTAFHSWIDGYFTDLSERSYGLEAMLRRDLTERIGGILSYTLSRTETTFGRDAIPSEFDRTHVVSAVLGVHLGAGFTLGVRGYYASGRRYAVSCPTPDCAPGDPTAPRDFEVRGRLPDFYRADARLEKRWEVGTTGWIAATLEWFNATLSKETTSASWSPVTGGIVYGTRAPLTLPGIGIQAGY
jgi:TonB family protein